MDDQEFRSLLDLFPVVRSRDHRAELDSSKQSTSQSVVDREVSEWHDAPTVAEPKDLQYLKTDQGMHHLFFSYFRISTKLPLAYWLVRLTSICISSQLFSAVSCVLKSVFGCSSSFKLYKFWENLKAAAEKKVGGVEAERFCKAFEKLHKKLVYEELDPEAAKRYLLNS
ncbi:hypothetical protein ISN45_At05g011320 [Arabidopsis thaliana x Arabidopsis arenosa]|uniref:Uncharacterized protein n=2 Tax=Arabidopsis TaxID=3701 RepID=A0A8T2DBH5_ARASU|nr:hypothetical protein ISN45_At05g011320 [Arabidopsis thaliana x Arabidopsis arenosa]KAG7608967.1 hypothetical protein ISN44_As05g011330 [Arabidopsis suecica]